MQSGQGPSKIFFYDEKRVGRGDKNRERLSLSWCVLTMDKIRTEAVTVRGCRVCDSGIVGTVERHNLDDDIRFIHLTCLSLL